PSPWPARAKERRDDEHWGKEAEGRDVEGGGETNLWPTADKKYGHLLSLVDCFGPPPHNAVAKRCAHHSPPPAYPRATRSPQPLYSFVNSPSANLVPGNATRKQGIFRSAAGVS
ncbi:unnamed protein product, partial [Mycena citricolor]